ncbi:type II secretion system minor pseudopilin GspK [Luteimonas salinilitoris]|uniref:Type II secretion system protein K n=1 Tax=Luteimonas salinilitoris TaxID=3237697 RepID=A0ABV4HLN2_9GAMM
MSRRRQRGIALLTVLLLVAVMAVLVMGVLDDIRFGLRRAGNAQSVAQAQWHALGAEALALAQIERLAARDPGRTTSEGDWNGRAFVFPVESGAISARLSDATACFNLNSVVQGGADTFFQHEIGVAQYVALLQALGFSEHQGGALADSLVDWIDSDQQREGLGHEDEAYARGRDGYRTAGTLLAETSELRAIHGYTAEVYARLRPHVCALPTVDLSPVNVNTLREEDAAILRMLTGGALDDARARRVIAARPADGWREVGTFLATLGAALPPSTDVNQVQVYTRYFRLHAEVEVGPAQVVLSALFEHDGSGPPRLLARRWSAEE